MLTENYSFEPFIYFSLYRKPIFPACEHESYSSVGLLLPLSLQVEDPPAA